ncbi:Osmotin thaumatin-like protein [Cubamyces lactineus]|nr:Osmotin thaumatin-like protein [Cubamyces lactineus]
MKGLIMYVSSAFLVEVSARAFTVYNNCPFTIWPAYFTTPGAPAPSQATGWSQNTYQSVTFYVPDTWSGRIWGRRDCNFDLQNPGPNSCLDGGCVGRLECDPKIGTGFPPATLAEFTLTGLTDNFDVSVVDGYNLPMRIENNKGCKVSDCPVDLGPNCPTPLKGPFDSTGFPVGCQSACGADLDGNPSNSSSCCTGYYNKPSTCKSSGVQYYSFFKANCPNAVVYAFDQSADNTCHGLADYTVVFCP